MQTSVPQVEKICEIEMFQTVKKVQQLQKIESFFASF